YPEVNSRAVNFRVGHLRSQWYVSSEGIPRRVLDVAGKHGNGRSFRAGRLLGCRCQQTGMGIICVRQPFYGCDQWRRSMINNKWCIGIGLLLLVAGCGTSHDYEADYTYEVIKKAADG